MYARLCVHDICVCLFFLCVCVFLYSWLWGFLGIGGKRKTDSSSTLLTPNVRAFHTRHFSANTK
jgi:hypothetical protein